MVMSLYFNGLKCLYSLLIMQVNVKMVLQGINLYSEWLWKSVKFASLPDKMTDVNNEMINFLSIFGFVVGRNTGYDFEHLKTFFTIAVVYICGYIAHFYLIYLFALVVFQQPIKIYWKL